MSPVFAVLIIIPETLCHMRMEWRKNVENEWDGDVACHKLIDED